MNEQYQKNLPLGDVEQKGQYNSTTHRLVLDDMPHRKRPLLGDIKRKGKYSSTMYRLVNDHCNKALDFHLRGLPEDTTKYQCGNTAHFILEYAGKEKAVEPAHQKAIADKTVAKLCAEGYYYFDKKQPAFKYELASEGREVALAWLERNSLPFDAQYENVFAMDAQGEACSIEDPRWRWRAKIDFFWIKTEEVNEESELKIGTTGDYKSSWSAGKSWLQSWQCKSQMVLIWLNHPELDGVCAEVINLRMNTVDSQAIYFDDEGIALLSKWRDEILEICDVMDNNREAQPGVGCVTCPFKSHCDAAIKVRSAKKNAAAYAIIEREREDLKKIIRAQLDDADGIACNGGFIGYDKKLRTVLKPGAEIQIVAAWYRVPLEDAAVMTRETSFVKALALGAGNLENFINTILSDASPTERQEFFELCATKEYRAEFGVHKLNGKNGNGQDNGLILLPADTKLAALPPAPEKAKRVKTVKVAKAKPTKKRKPKKAAAKKTAKKKTAKRKPAKHKTAAKLHSVKNHKTRKNSTNKKSAPKKRGRKARR